MFSLATGTSIFGVVKRRTEAAAGGTKECLHSGVTILVLGHERRSAVPPATARTTVGGSRNGLIVSRSLHQSSSGWRRVGRGLAGHALFLGDIQQKTTLDLVQTVGRGVALLLGTVQLVLRHEGWDVHGNHSEGNVDVGWVILGLGTLDTTGCHGRFAPSAGCGRHLLFRLGRLLLLLDLVLVVRSAWGNPGLPTPAHAYCPRGAAGLPGIIVDTAVIVAEFTQ